MAAWFLPLILGGMSALGSAASARASAPIGTPEATAPGGGTKFVQTPELYSLTRPSVNSLGSLASNLLGEYVQSPHYGTSFTMPNFLNLQAGMLKNPTGTSNMPQAPDSKGGMFK